MALGSGSVADEANTVSVGSSGNERRITNVVDGTQPTDAATFGQLTTMDDALQSQIAKLSNSVNTLRSETQKGIAGAAALITPTIPLDPGETGMALNTGLYRGETAIGVSISHRFNTSMPILVEAGYANGAGGEGVARAGIAIKF